MGYHPLPASGTAPLFRPKLLIETARIGARLYRRERDLAAAVPGLAAAAGRIVARLTEAERRCEEMRRGRSPAYRPGQHVQILSALIAEAGRDPAQP
jgi:hypothetical protein